MGSNQEMVHCKRCKQMTMHLIPGTSHVLHVILSIITAGLWLPVWLLVHWNNRTWSQCSSCGRKRGVFG